LGNEEIAGVTGPHLYDVGLGSEALDLFFENDFDVRHDAGLRVNGELPSGMETGSRPINGWTVDGPETGTNRLTESWHLSRSHGGKFDFPQKGLMIGD
jgi:hypothetical protein